MRVDEDIHPEVSLFVPAEYKYIRRLDPFELTGLKYFSSPVQVLLTPDQLVFVGYHWATGVRPSQV